MLAVQAAQVLMRQRSEANRLARHSMQAAVVVVQAVLVGQAAAEMQTRQGQRTQVAVAAVTEQPQTVRLAVLESYS